MQEQKYGIGQAWNYQTREGEEGSYVTIALVEEHEKFGTIYHISIEQVSFRNPNSPTGIQSRLPHAPVTSRTLDDSVTTLITDQVNLLPDISIGYGQWRDAKGGVFTIPVKDIVKFIEEVVNS